MLNPPSRMLNRRAGRAGAHVFTRLAPHHRPWRERGCSPAYAVKTLLFPS